MQVTVNKNTVGQIVKQLERKQIDPTVCDEVKTEIKKLLAFFNFRADKIILDYEDVNMIHDIING